MASLLSRKQLLERLLRAVDESGWRALIIDPHKPFRLHLFHGEENGFDVRVYLWNCTHGGGDVRARDEYRVQITAVVPSEAPGEITLLLGWHSGYGVFAGWDIKKHSGQDSNSPSVQIKEETLENAHTHAFAIHQRHNGEIAIAFRPEFFVEYATNATALHLTDKAAADMSLLNSVDTLTDSQVATVKSQERQVLITQIARRFRAADFRKRVLGAYAHRCAVCGVQLELIDAAHIVPVAVPTSTDETKNGIALCKLHHTAFDRNLISFDERYKIEVNEAETSRLTEADRARGLKEFRHQLLAAIILPADRRDYPAPEYIAEARKVRSWGL